MSKAEELHNNLIEHAAEGEESLMEKYFEEGTLSEEDMEKVFVSVSFIATFSRLSVALLKME